MHASSMTGAGPSNLNWRTDPIVDVPDKELFSVRSERDIRESQGYSETPASYFYT